MHPMSEDGDCNMDMEGDMESTRDSSEVTLLPNTPNFFCKNSTISGRLVIVGCIGLSLPWFNCSSDKVQSLSRIQA